MQRTSPSIAIIGAGMGGLAAAATLRIQAISSANTWMKGGDDDTSWLYGNDAWNVPLMPTESFARTT